MSIEVNISEGLARVNISGTFTEKELRELMQGLADARAQISTDPATLSVGASLNVVPDPAYWTEYGPATHGRSMLAFRFPGFGWMGILLAMPEVARLAKYLNEHLTIALSAPASTTAGDAIPMTGNTSGGNTMH